MKLATREKILAAVAGGIVLLPAIWFLFLSGDERSSDKLRAERTRLTADMAAKQTLVDAAAREGKQLAAWQARALPADPTIARSLYQNWLRSLASRTKLRRVNVDSKEVESRTGMFTRLSFAIHANASLADLTRFLYEFYAAGHLHQIRNMDIKPLENSRDLDVNLTIEAVSLPDADNKDQLTKESGHELRLAKLDEYLEPIVKRNLFAPPTATIAVETVDPAQYAFVTAFTEVNAMRQVWIQDRLAGKTWQLAAGDGFQIGALRGTVIAIEPPHEVVVELDGHRRRLRDGENLREGVEVRR
jgi:hypothetical protein